MMPQKSPAEEHSCRITRIWTLENCTEAIRAPDLRQDFVKPNGPVTGENTTMLQHTPNHRKRNQNSNTNDSDPPGTTPATQPYDLAWWNTRSCLSAPSHRGGAAKMITNTTQPSFPCAYITKLTMPTHPLISYYVVQQAFCISIAYLTS